MKLYFEKYSINNVRKLMVLFDINKNLCYIFFRKEANMPEILVSVDGQDDSKTYYERVLDLWFVPQIGSTLDLLIGGKAERIKVNKSTYQEESSRVILECTMDDPSLFDKNLPHKDKLVKRFDSDPYWWKFFPGIE